MLVVIIGLRLLTSGHLATRRVVALSEYAYCLIVCMLIEHLSLTVSAVLLFVFSSSAMRFMFIA